MSAKVTAKAVSQVSNQLPSFITDEHKLFEVFIKDYYEFLETIRVDYTLVSGFEDNFTVGETVTGQTSGATAKVKATGSYTGIPKLFLEPTNNLDFIADEQIIGSTSASRATVSSIVRQPLNATKSFLSLLDTDETTAGMLQRFRQELFPNIRKDAEIDFKSLIKNLKDFYRSRGSEKSYRALFRILYGQDNLDLYYPKEDILRVSAGDWNQDVVLQLPYDASYLNFNGLTIVGLSSEATAFVSNVTTRRLGTIIIIELVTTNRTGTFTIGETIRATLPDGSTLTATTSGMVTGYTINDGGNGYEIGDSIVISDSVGFGAVASVANTTGDQVSTISIDNPGNGYQVGQTIVFDNTGTNATVTAEAQIATISDAYTLSIATTQLFEGIETVSFNIATPFGVTVNQGYLIADNAVFANATKVGEIISLSTLELRIYDRSQGDGTLTAFADSDVLYLFNESGTPITGASSVQINDSSLTNPTLDIVLNSADFNGNFAEPSGTYSSVGTTVTIEIPDGHNLTSSNVITLDFVGGALDGVATASYSIDSIINSTAFTVSTALSTTSSGTANLIANINSVIQNALTFEDQEFGSIASIDIISHGSGYESAPSVEVETTDYYSGVFEVDTVNGGFFGRNAEISVSTPLGGSVNRVEITEPGFGYTSAPTFDLTGSGDGTADIDSTITTLRTKDGKFASDQGQPSSTKRLQDNDFYQDFSYVLKTTDSVNVWRKDVLKLLHPAGFKLFGEVAITSVLNAQMFDRGTNNINSVDENGQTVYRNLEFSLITLVLGLTAFAADTEIHYDIEIETLLQLLSNTSQEVKVIPTYYSEDLTINSTTDYQIERSNPISNDLTVQNNSLGFYRTTPTYSTTNIPTEMFSLMSVKELSSADLSTMTFETSEPHYFHDNDVVFLNEFEGTNVELVNGNEYVVTVVDSTTFTLADQYNPSGLDYSSVSITANGKAFRVTNEMSSGVIIDLMDNEYIGEYADYSLDHYMHTSPADFSAYSNGDEFQINARNLVAEFPIGLENGDNLLLEDQLPEADINYQGEASNLGSMIQETILDLDENTEELILTEGQLNTLNSVSGELLVFDKVFNFSKIPYQHNNGFAYFKHRIQNREFVS